MHAIDQVPLPGLGSSKTAFLRTGQDTERRSCASFAVGLRPAMERRFSGPGGKGWGPPEHKKLPRAKQGGALCRCAAWALSQPDLPQATPWGPQGTVEHPGTEEQLHSLEPDRGGSAVPRALQPSDLHTAIPFYSTISPANHPQGMETTSASSIPWRRGPHGGGSCHTLTLQTCVEDPVLHPDHPSTCLPCPQADFPSPRGLQS